jgi:glycosyltransferase involved in cell wall biosynthesis
VADQVHRGYEVHVASPADSEYVRATTELGASHHEWPATRSPSVRVTAETRSLARIVNRVDPDLVVLHSSKAGLAGRLAVRGRRSTVFAPHAWSFVAVRGPVGALAAGWEAFAARWTHRIICVSEDERAVGQDEGIQVPTVVVPNGVDVGVLSPRPAGAARQRLGLPHAPTAVCVGRLAEQKGQDQLLDAWAEVLSVVPDARLVLVGDGPLRETLEARAPHGVLFAGAQLDPSDYYAAADVVAVPSRWEGGPLVPLEAMAMARPVVAFDVAGVRAALGTTGAVLQPGDVRGLAAALIRLLADPAAAAADGRAARVRALEVADLRTSLRSWDDVVSELIGDRSGATPSALGVPR